MMKVMTMMMKAKQGMAFLAAALIGVSAFTARGGQVDWIVCDNIFGHLYDTTLDRGVDQIYGVTFYLIPFTFDIYGNVEFDNGEYAEVEAGLLSPIPTFDESRAFASLTLGGLNLSFGAPPSLTSLNPIGKVDLDSLPTEFFLLAFVHYAAPQSDTFYGTAALIPGTYAGDPFNPGSFSSDDDILYQLSSLSAFPSWPWYDIPVTYTIIPEPTTGLLALVGAATLLLRRRKR